MEKLELIEEALEWSEDWVRLLGETALEPLDVLGVEAGDAVLEVLALDWLPNEGDLNSDLPRRLSLDLVLLGGLWLSSSPLK